jgi:hypothetical protein
VPAYRHIIGNEIDGAIGDHIKAESVKQDVLLDQVDRALDEARCHVEVLFSAYERMAPF